MIRMPLFVFTVDNCRDPERPEIEIGDEPTEAKARQSALRFLDRGERLGRVIRKEDA